MPMIRKKAVRNESLETNNARDCLQSCGYLSKWTSFLLFRVRMLRIRGRTLRTEPLDRSNARDSERVVRILREVDVSPVSPSSTTWYEKKRLETNHWSKPTQASLKTMCVWFEKWTSFLLFRVRMLRKWGRKTYVTTFKDQHIPLNSPLAFLSHLHYHRTNKKKEFFICTRIAFAAIINVFIPGWP